MEQEYIYYIAKRPVRNDTLTESLIPAITKVRKNKLPFEFEFTDKNEAEGPFTSLFELKSKSYIFSTIKLEKHKQRVLKNKNIHEIKNFILTPQEASYEKTFLAALYHTMVGKISKQKVKGVHFFNPDNTRILEKICVDINGVYIARIEQLDKNTGKWILKDEKTNFFPDRWTVHQLFHECAHAYMNKRHVSGKTFEGKSLSGISIKIFINEQGKILTFFPEIKLE